MALGKFQFLAKSDDRIGFAIQTNTYIYTDIYTLSLILTLFIYKYS